LPEPLEGELLLPPELLEGDTEGELLLLGEDDTPLLREGDLCGLGAVLAGACWRAGGVYEGCPLGCLEGWVRCWVGAGWLCGLVCGRTIWGAGLTGCLFSWAGLADEGVFPDCGRLYSWLVLGC